MTDANTYNRHGVQIWRGDCLQVMPSLTSASVDLIVTSPPYNCGKVYGEFVDQQERQQYWTWIESVMVAATRLLKPHGYLVVNHANYIGSRELRQFVPDEMCPILSRCLPFRDWIIWNKGPCTGAAWGNFRTSPRIRAQHENIWIHGGCVQMPPSDIEWPEWSKLTTSVWDVPTAGVDKKIHPAMMPVEVARRLVMLYSPAGGTVCDPFSGSGTTAIAAVRCGRKFIGCEIDKEHWRKSCERIDREKEQGQLFIA
jgi:site-specific DNA-methyltransferase (adenine-specific)